MGQLSLPVDFVVDKESLRKKTIEVARLVLIELMEDTHPYNCNRGPRKSAAALLPIYGDVVYGYVEPIGYDNCFIAGCMIEDGHCVRNLHAEVNAIIKAGRSGIPTVGSSLISINKPCYNCTMHALAAGVSTIYYAYAVYDEERTQKLLEMYPDVEVIHVPIDV